MTHAPETGTRNRRHNVYATFRRQFFCDDARLLTTLTAFGPRRQSTTLEVVHRHGKLTPESGVEVTPMAPISGTDFWSVCPGL